LAARCQIGSIRISDRRIDMLFAHIFRKGRPLGLEARESLATSGTRKH
jgi:hypothetical protein